MQAGPADPQCTAATLTRPLFTFCCLLCLAWPAAAAINAFGLGASYDSTKSNVVFRVYSSRATRIEVHIYTTAMRSPEVLHFPLNPDSSTKIFSVSIPVATLRTAGVTGPVYYGYRASGPNRPYSSA